jgi:multiple sugar transport system permease protein
VSLGVRDLRSREPATVARTGVEVPHKAPRRRRVRPTPYLLILPAAGLYGLFTIFPIVRQVQISFFQWHIEPGASNPFLGWSNYSAIFHDPEIRTAAWNTLLYIVITVPVQMLLGLVAAGFLTDRLPGRTLWRTLIFIPVLTSWVVVAYLFSYIFNSSQDGLVNVVLSQFAGHTVRIAWLQQTWTANAVIWLLGIWKGVGWSFVMFLAALDGVPLDGVEAARVDGATELLVWRKVIVPGIRATTTFVFVLLVIGGAQVFQSVYLMTSAQGVPGTPYGSTNVLFTWAYYQAFTLFSFGYAAAIATMLAVILVGFSVVEIRLLRRDDQ